MTDSARERQHVFIVGCQRSGTTWLQLLLARHPDVATVNETNLVSDYLGPTLRRWDVPEGSRRETGLGQLFTREEFVEHLRTIARSAFQGFPGDDPPVLLEKTPQNAVWGAELLEIVPDARVLHLVRDPRDVAASLLAAADDWGEGWAPGNAYDAAWRWREYVASARSIRNRTDRYRELRYEDLHAAPDEELSDLLAWLELPCPEGFPERAVEETRLSRMRGGEAEAPWNLADEPEGFFRKGGSGNWREELSGGQARLVEHVCRDGMEAYGYGRDGSWPLPPLRLLPYWLRDRLHERIC